MARFIRRRFAVRGAVQGVGFRPFVYRLAHDLNLVGTVLNNSAGVVIEVEGAPEQVDLFGGRLVRDRPAISVIQSLEAWDLAPVGYEAFEILESESDQQVVTVAMPDLAICQDCLREVRDPKDRRFRYPFTNCTNCGPRFSILKAFPYDRPNTTMAEFRMCPVCKREYGDPTDRRFHAQPNACPRCGPVARFTDPSGRVKAWGDEAIRMAANMLFRGGIVALKGTGGYQLLVDARDEAAVVRLRESKRREFKPLAVMVADLDSARRIALVSELEEQTLLSTAAPIVLLESLSSDLAQSVAPDNPYLGLMIPCSALHQILADDLGFPIVATSGNVSDEPICIDDVDALDRLGNIADGFLTHNRQIVRQVDDSVVRVAANRVLVLRRARGYAPLPVPLKGVSRAVLGYGGHYKNTVTFAFDGWGYVSQHIGDLDTPSAVEAMHRGARDLPGLYDRKPERVVSDFHPDFASTHAAEQTGLPHTRVQHHLAHVLAVMAENEVDGPVLGVSWDGTGLGTDKTIWGGEFLQIQSNRAKRVACFRPFPLIGGDVAAKEPRRSALSLFWTANGVDAVLPEALSRAFSSSTLATLRTMFANKVNCPMTSSVGRLFDAVAFFCGLGALNRFEGDCPAKLEYAAHGRSLRNSFCLPLLGGLPVLVDWEPMLVELLKTTDVSEASVRFHAGLVDVVARVAERFDGTVALGGGCFQNRVLLEGVVQKLDAMGRRVVWSQRIPPNDASISLGQVAAVALGVEWED